MHLFVIFHSYYFNEKRGSIDTYGYSGHFYGTCVAFGLYVISEKH